MNIQEFLIWEMSSRDTIDVKKVYIDMAGELVAGVMLSQIVYWHMPGKDGKSRLRVEKDGYLWLAKKAAEWWEECRISGKQAARSIDVLQDRKLVIAALYKFNGAPTTHVRINWPDFLMALNSILPVGQNPISALGKMDITESGNSLTETTPETTPETQESGAGAPKPEKPDKQELDRMYDLICELCDLDPKQVGKVVGKVRGELLKVGWTSAGLTAFRDWRKSKALAPIGSVHWLQGELAKQGWRGQTRAAQGAQPDQEDVDFVERKRREKAAREAQGK